MSNLIFPLLLTLIILLEGIGISYDREIPLYLIIILPVISFIANRTKRVKIPSRLGILFGSFIAFSSISTLLSIAIQKSIDYLLLYISLGLIFLFVYNNREKIQKLIAPLMFGFAAFFTIYSSLLLSLPQGFQYLEPRFGYQVVFSRFVSHNHLGDFLLLPLVICFYNLLNKRRSNLLLNSLTIILFLPYFLFSYSRSAYISLILVLLVMIFNFIRAKDFRPSLASIGFLLFSLVLSFIFLFSVASNSGNIPILNKVNMTLGQKNELSPYKPIWGQRGEYLHQAELSILERPLFGVGPGNFVDASRKFMSAPRLWTESAHNIFLDIFVENGIPAGIVFILLIFELFRRSEKNLYFYLALALLVNFQTDYTYRIFSFLLLFFALLGLTYREKIINH